MVGYGELISLLKSLTCCFHCVLLCRCVLYYLIMTTDKPPPRLAEEALEFPSAARRRRWGSKPLALTLKAADYLMKQIGKRRDISEKPILSASRLGPVLGNSTSSSAFARKIGALRAFGFITDESKGEYRPTDLGVSVASPTTPEVRAESLQKALLKVSVHKRIFEQHKGKLLPTNEFLMNLVEQECQISKDDSEEWVTLFRKDAEYAGMLHDQGGGRIIVSTGGTVEPVMGHQQTDKSSMEKKAPPPVAADKSPEPSEEAFGYTARIKLSGGKDARFSLPDQLSKSDVDKLKKALEGLSVILDSMAVTE